MRWMIALALAGGAWCQPVRVTHGPMLGHVTEDSVKIWVRTSRPGDVRVIYGTAPEKLTRTSAPVRTLIERDQTGWLHLTGLEPNTRYWYQPVTANDAGYTGSFRTLPKAAGFFNAQTNPKGLFNFRFQFGSCANQNAGNGNGPTLPAYATMMRDWQDKIAFSIMNGDWLYENKREFTAEEWREQNGVRDAAAMPSILKLAPSIAGVWENYKYFLERGANLAQWHRSVPSYYTPDDHEILNDVYGTGEVGRRDRRTVFRDIGMRSWFDYLAGSQPTANTQEAWFGAARLQAGSDVLTDAAADFSQLDLKQVNNLHVHWGGQYAGVDTGKFADREGDPNAGVYEVVQVLDKNRLRIRPAARASLRSTYSVGRLSYGSFRVGNVEVFLLDTRSQRDLHDTDNPTKPGTSMIGKAQKAWLKEKMKASDADFFFLASSVNLTIPHVSSPAGGEIKGKDDAWTAFVEEREELIKFWDGLDKPVLVMTGDLHNSFAVKVTGKVWEFAAGPLGSQNHPAKSEGGRPPNGMFDSRGRPVDIRWSSYVRDDLPLALRKMPYFAVAQVNNVFNNPAEPGKDRWVAFPRPHVVIQYYNGLTGELVYAESVHR